MSCNLTIEYKEPKLMPDTPTMVLIGDDEFIKEITNSKEPITEEQSLLTLIHSMIFAIKKKHCE